MSKFFLRPVYFSHYIYNNQPLLLPCVIIFGSANDSNIRKKWNVLFGWNEKIWICIKNSVLWKIQSTTDWFVHMYYEHTSCTQHTCCGKFMSLLGKSSATWDSWRKNWAFCVGGSSVDGILILFIEVPCQSETFPLHETNDDEC